MGGEEGRADLLCIALQLWPMHKRFCGTGVEVWYEDDLTEEELQRLDAIAELRDSELISTVVETSLTQHNSPRFSLSHRSQRGLRVYTAKRS